MCKDVGSEHKVVHSAIKIAIQSCMIIRVQKSRLTACETAFTHPASPHEIGVLLRRRKSRDIGKDRSVAWCAMANNNNSHPFPAQIPERTSGVTLRITEFDRCFFSARGLLVESLRGGQALLAPPPAAALRAEPVLIVPLVGQPVLTWNNLSHYVKLETNPVHRLSSVFRSLTCTYEGAPVEELVLLNHHLHVAACLGDPHVLDVAALSVGAPLRDLPKPFREEEEGVWEWLELLTGCAPPFSGCLAAAAAAAEAPPGLMGGLTPLTFMISPVLPLGRGGGGCLRGSVGLSDGLGRLTTFLAGGGVMGRGMRLGGDGDGGLARTDDFGGGGDGLVGLRERCGEKDLDLEGERTRKDRDKWKNI
ncbi:hypothetical protein NQ318_016225 [Aromia moschata]|uniref:Uncharacterized protein n=1 Tax=Aromia moschata TaxID=1265417 RepID=A0AAV8XA63_9CUCU|nr:hypothetical protein NQ318_016225 [Aromia moschata]